MRCYSQLIAFFINYIVRIVPAVQGHQLKCLFMYLFILLMRPLIYLLYYIYPPVLLISHSRIYKTIYFEITRFNRLNKVFYSMQILY